MRKGLNTAALLALISIISLSCQKPETPPDSTSSQETTQPTEPPKPQPAPGKYVLPLIETTDIHGHIVDTDESGTVLYRLAYVADKADDMRGHGDARKKDRLLLLDGGDLYQGASVSNLLSGWPLFVAIDQMGYDAVALGNHEFDWGIENTVDSDATLPDYEWNSLPYENKVPVLCANLYKDGQRVSFTSDYTIVEKSALAQNGDEIPVKIGIVGFAVNYASSIMSSQFTGKGFSIRADYSIVNTIAQELETNHGCHATILLTHGQAQSAAESLGSSSPIDLVLGGHSHGVFNDKTSWGLPYLQGGCYCTHYAAATLRFILDEKGNISFAGIGNMAVPSVNAASSTATSENADDLSEEILAVSDAALEATAQQQKEVLGYIKVGATTSYLQGSGQRAATMSNWMCDLIRRIGHADVAFVNSGGIRTSFPLNGQSRRDITVANVYEMFPFNNHVYVYSLTYEELLQVFQYALTSGGSALFSRMTGLDCYFSSGVVIKLIKDGTTIYHSGVWTSDWSSRSVTMAVSDYVATTERTDYYTGMPNPLIEWNQTSRLIESNAIDNESAVAVLREESAASGGHLYIDTSPHFIQQ